MDFIARRINPKETSPKDEDPVQRLLAVGNHLAEQIGAFQGLGLSSNQERNLFTQRLAIELFQKLCPENPWKNAYQPTERLMGENYNMTSEYANTKMDIKSSFERTGDEFTISIKRAIGHAARECTMIVINDLQQLKQHHVYLHEFRLYCFSPDPPTMACLRSEFPLYQPTTKALGEVEGYKGFKQIFAQYRRDIEGFKQHLAVPLEQQSVLSPS